MSDVADMLGLSRPQAVPVKVNPTEMTQAVDKKVKKKPKGMKREVFDLLGPDGLLPATQVASGTPGFKSKRATALKGKWVSEPINNSARSDSNSAFRHWVKADITYLDYPYAKFNIRLDRPTYTDAEYALLEDPAWSREDTSLLLDACVDLDLRWPIIFDRLVLSTPKPVEELMARYYFIAQRVKQMRSSAQGRPADEPLTFDLEKERKRRMQQDLLFRRTKEDEAEEVRIKEELKSIEAMLKKNKKVAKASTSSSAASAGIAAAPIAPPAVQNGNEMLSFQAPLADSRGLLQATTTNPIAETYSAPQPGKPCMQSSRLYLSNNPSCPNLSKTMVAKMHNYLKEAGLPEHPIATKAVCDRIDVIRKDTIALVSLSNLIAKKEKELGAAKSNSGKPASKAAAKSSKPKARSKAAAAADGAADVKMEPGAQPTDADGADASVADASVEHDQKPVKPAPKKRNRGKKEPVEKMDLEVFDDISPVDYDLPAGKRTKG